MYRALLVARELDGLPDLLVRRLLAHPVQLRLELVELARKPCAAEQGHVAEPTESLAQAQLGAQTGASNSLSSLASVGRSSGRGTIASRLPKR